MWLALAFRTALKEISLAEDSKKVNDVQLSKLQRRKALTGLASCALARKDHMAVITICKRLLTDNSIPAADKAAIQSSSGWAFLKLDEPEVFHFTTGMA